MKDGGEGTGERVSNKGANRITADCTSSGERALNSSYLSQEPCLPAAALSSLPASEATRHFGLPAESRQIPKIPGEPS